MVSQAQEALQRLASEVTSHAAGRWLAEAKLEQHGGSYVLHVGSTIQKRWFETRLKERLGRALKAPVEIRAENEVDTGARVRVRPNLVGPAGEFAIGIVRAFVHGGPAAVPRVVVHGPARCGKSVLADWAASQAPSRVFVLDLERIVRGGSRGLVPRKPLVIADGVERLAGRPGAQRTLCTIIDAIQDRGDRMLLTVEDHPNRNLELAAALRSRMTGSVLVPLEAPTTGDVRLQLRERARRRGTRLPREWEEELAGLPPAAALRALDMRMVEPSDAQPIDVADALELMKHCAARLFGVPREELDGGQRRRTVVEARRAIMAAARMRGVDEKTVARAFQRSVRTVRDACRWAAAEQERDGRFAALLHELGRVLPNG
jgi:chromosomal replication initiation ATPase DnaA